MKKTAIFILLFILVYVLFELNSYGMIPDWMHVSLMEKPGDYFQLILTATAAIFGVVIAVTLVTFQLLAKDNPLRHKKRDLLNDNFIVFSIALPVSILLLSLASFMRIRKFEVVGEITIAYYIGILFILFVLLLYPAMKRILSITDSLKKTQEDIGRISLEEIQRILPLKDERFVAKQDILLVKIRNRLTNYVRDCDYETYTTIVETLNARIRYLIGDGRDRRRAGEIFQAFKFILEPGIYEALRVGNYQYYITVWESIDELFEYAAKKKIRLLHYEQLSSFVDDYISFLINNKLSDALRKASDIVLKAFELNLKYNCPPQEQIINLYWIYDEDHAPTKDHDSDSSMQWMKIDEIFSDFENIYIKSVELKDKELYQACYWATSHIIFAIKYGDIGKIGPMLQRRVVESIFAVRTEAANLANKNNMYDYFGWTFNMDEFAINEFITARKPYVRFILERTGDLLIRSQRLEKINDESIHNLGGIARVACKEYMGNETARRAIRYIFRIMEHLKTCIEGQLPDQANNYLLVKKQMESIRYYLSEAFPGGQIDLLGDIELQLKLFLEVKEDPAFILLNWDE